jgi:hypothetical protein
MIMPVRMSVPSSVRKSAMRLSPSLVLLVSASVGSSLIFFFRGDDVFDALLDCAWEFVELLVAAWAMDGVLP